MPGTNEQKYFGMSFNQHQQPICHSAHLTKQKTKTHPAKHIAFTENNFSLTYDKSLPAKQILRKHFTLMLTGTQNELTESEILHDLQQTKHNRNKAQNLTPILKHNKLENTTKIADPDNYKRKIEKSTFHNKTPIAQSIDADFENADVDNLFKNNSLNFVTAYIDNGNGELTQTQCNVDTGANISLININYFLSVPNGTIKTRNVDFALHHVGKNCQRIQEIALIPLTFQKGNKKVTITNPFLISPTCIYEILLGTDFLNKLQSIINVGKYIDINENFENPNKKPSYLRLPIIDFPSARIPFLVSTEHGKVKPGETKSIKCRLIQSGKIKPDDKFICTDHPLSDLSVKECTMQNLIFEYKQVTVTNNTKNQIKIKPNTIIAAANQTNTLSDHQQFEKVACPVNVYKKTLDQLDKKKEREAAVEEAKKILAKDKDLTEEEREDALEEFIESGYLPLSVSAYTSSNNNFTELPAEDVPELTDEEVLKAIDLSHLSEIDRELATEFLKNNLDVFARHPLEARRTNLLKAYVELKPGTENRIWEQKRIPIHPQLKDRVAKVIDKMRQYNLLEEADPLKAKVISNLMVVRKQSKNALRFILDSRITNSITKKMHCINPTKQEIFTFLSNRQYITTCDANNGYFTIPYEEESKNYFVFADGLGKLWKYSVLVQGFLNSNTFYNALMHKITADLNCMNYVDDIIISDSQETFNNPSIKCTFAQHLDSLQVLFNRLRQANVCLSPKKLRLGNKVVKIIGHVIQHDRIYMSELKRIDLARFPTPESPRKMLAWCAASQFYKDMIPRYAELIHPLRQASKLLPQKFKLTPKLREQFLKAQSKFENVDPLFAPDLNAPFYATSDASQVAVSFQLFQKDPNDKTRRRLISNYSRLLTKSEANKPVYHLEALAMHSGLKANDYILRHCCHITLFNDNLNLCYMRLTLHTNPIIFRLAAQLMNYPFSIEYVRSKDNEFADLGSRPYFVKKEKNRKTISEQEAVQFLHDLTNIFPDRVSISNELVQKLLTAHPLYSNKIAPQKKQKSKSIDINKILPDKVYPKQSKIPRNKEIVAISEKQKSANACTVDLLDPIKVNNPSDIIVNSMLLRNGKLSIDDFKIAQELDNSINEILTAKELPKGYFIRGGILMKNVQNREKICLPLSLLLVWFCNLHVTLEGGLHTSKDAMKQIISENYHIKDLDTHLRNFTQSCYTCQRAKHCQDKKSTFHETKIPTHARERINVDLCSGLPPSGKRNYTHILVICDQFDNFTHLLPLRSRSSEEILEAFKYGYLNHEGQIRTIFCDNEPAITDSTEFKHFAQINNIDIESTASLCPFSNGRAEKKVGQVKTLIKAFVDSTKKTWSERLYRLNNLINATPLSYTKNNYSSEILHYGFSNVDTGEPLDFAKISDNYESYVETIKNWSRDRVLQAQPNRESRTAHSRDFLNRTRDELEFEVGEIVFMKNDIIQGNNATKLQFLGPFQIEHIFPNSKSLCLIRDFATAQLKRCHFMQLRKAKSKFVPFGIPLSTDAEKLIRTKNKEKHTYNLRQRK